MALTSWEQTAAAKRQSVLNAIPEKWRIKGPIPAPTEQRDVTGPYIQQFLSPREVEITETDAVGITERTTTGQWTAVEVTEAFCHRAALAHQLVHFPSTRSASLSSTNRETGKLLARNLLRCRA